MGYGRTAPLTSSPRLGAFIGLTSAYSLGDKFSLSADVQYSQKGYGLLGYETAPEYRYTYIDFMPEVAYRLFKTVSLSMGFNYAFLTQQVSKSGNGNWSAVREEEAILTTDFGLSGKVQARFGHFYGFFRYNQGLKDLSNTTKPATQDGGAKRPVLHNNNLQFGLGYAFGYR